MVTTKTDLIRIRAEPGHKEAWRAAAAADGRKLSEWFRWLAERRSVELEMHKRVSR